MASRRRPATVAFAVAGALVLAGAPAPAAAQEPTYVPGIYVGTDDDPPGVSVIGFRATAQRLTDIVWRVTIRCSDGDLYRLDADEPSGFSYDRRSLRPNGTLRVAGAYAENDVRYVFKVKGRLDERDAAGQLRVRASRSGDDVTCRTGWMPWDAEWRSEP